MGRHGDKKKIDALPRNFEERDEFAQLIYWARRAARAITYTTWTLGIIAATGGVIFSSWVWLSALAFESRIPGIREWQSVSLRFLSSYFLP